jgi:hypothetical protein
MLAQAKACYSIFSAKLSRIRVKRQLKNRTNSNPYLSVSYTACLINGLIITTITPILKQIFCAFFWAKKHKKVSFFKSLGNISLDLAHKVA